MIVSIHPELNIPNYKPEKNVLWAFRMVDLQEGGALYPPSHTLAKRVMGEKEVQEWYQFVLS